MMTYLDNTHKYDLVLIQPFPANRNFASGFIEYLSEYFNVHYIDLPGFHPDIAPLKKVTLSGYRKYVEEKIDSLNLDTYILSGISFGAMLANQVKVDERCLCVLSLAPYLGPKYHRLNDLIKDFIKLGVKRMKSTNQLDSFWERSWVSPLFVRGLGLNKDLFNRMRNEIDSRTYLLTAELLLSQKSKPRFQNKPYVVFLNPNCSIIDYEKTHSEYSRSVENVNIIDTKMAHFPKDLSYEYFKESLPVTDVDIFMEFVIECDVNRVTVGERNIRKLSYR